MCGSCFCPIVASLLNRRCHTIAAPTTPTTRPSTAFATEPRPSARRRKTAILNPLKPNAESLECLVSFRIVYTPPGASLF